MNTITTASTKPILAIDLGKYKSPDGLGPPYTRLAFISLTNDAIARSRVLL
jgi:hypothetical protein